MPKAFKWTSEALQDMAISYQQGETAQSIARRYGTSHQVIIPVLKKHGVQLRSRHERHYGHSRHTFDARYFQVIDTEEKAYWPGFLTAGGCVTLGKKTEESPRITVCLGKQDSEHLFKFKQALQASQAVSISRQSCSFTICSSEMARDLAGYGMQPRKTLHTIPAVVSSKLERHYWRGVIDGAGHISKDGKQLVLVGDAEMVLGFQAFMLAHCPKVKAMIFRKVNIYSFKITGTATASPAVVLSLPFIGCMVLATGKEKRECRLVQHATVFTHGSDLPCNPQAIFRCQGATYLFFLGLRDRGNALLRSLSFLPCVNTEVSPKEFR